MNKFFYLFVVSAILAGCVLFGLSYVGVGMAAVLVPVFILCIILAYIFRPRELKTIQNNIYDTTCEFVSDANKTLVEINTEKKLSKIIDKKNSRKNNITYIKQFSQEEYSAIIEHGVDIEKYIQLKKIAKEKQIDLSFKDLIECALENKNK